MRSSSSRATTSTPPYGLEETADTKALVLELVGPAGLAGLVSIGDLVKHIASAQETEIRFLNDYIQGRYSG